MCCCLNAGQFIAAFLVSEFPAGSSKCRSVAAGRIMRLRHLQALQLVELCSRSGAKSRSGLPGGDQPLLKLLLAAADRTMHLPCTA